MATERFVVCNQLRLGVVRTLGVDLAAQPAKTGVCLIQWDLPRGPAIEHIGVGADDALVVELAKSSDRVAIDCPLGWPQAFVAFLVADGSGSGAEHTASAVADDIFWRLTDQRIKPLRTPLSVAADRIARTAFRCVRLQHALAAADIPVDRSGTTGRVIEAYPAASLVRWGLMPAASYKNKDAAGVLATLAASLVDAVGSIHLATGTAFADVISALSASDDHVDGFVCALVARAHASGRTDGAPCGEDELSRARAEGWIHLPTADSLRALGG